MTTTAPEQAKTNPLQQVPKELLASPGFLLGRLGHTIKGRAMGEFERAGFDGYHYSVMAVLGQGACDTQAAIADSLALDRSQLVGILDSLEERGLIERHRDREDRRRHVVTLTSAGRKQLVRLRSIVRKIEDEFFEPLDAKAREQFHALLLQLAAHHDPRCGAGT